MGSPRSSVDTAGAEPRDYLEIAKGYARDIGAGRIPACKNIRLQAARFLAELKASREKKFPYRMDAAKAARACTFIELLPHTKGKWARERRKLVLEPWQVWVLVATFGWVHKEGLRAGLRRFRRLVLVIPRKNGKSAISAGIALYMFCADSEHGAEVYVGARTVDQAIFVFEPAQLMVKKSPALAKAAGITVLANSMVRFSDNSKMEAVTGNPGDGASPSCSVHDEYHEHPDDRQVDTMLTGMGARAQPLQVIITTAGFNLAGPCYALIREERDKLAGIGLEGGGPPIEDETLFVEYTIDDEDDWKDELVWRKANPNFGVSVLEDYLAARRRDALASARKSGALKTKHLNLWVAAKSAFFDIEAWRRCSIPEVPLHYAEALERFRGRRAIIGLDVALSRDIFAMECLILPEGDKATVTDPYIRIGKYFLPADTVDVVPHYQGWDAAGLIDVGEGPVNDFAEIELAVMEAAKVLQVEAVPYDPWNATQTAQRLLAEGLPMIEFGQQARNQSAPMKELDALMATGRIAHGGCPVMEWQMSNVVARADVNDNYKPDKPRGDVKAKIDSPVALISALGVAMAGGEDAPPASPWDDPEFRLTGEEG